MAVECSRIAEGAAREARRDAPSCGPRSAAPAGRPAPPAPSALGAAFHPRTPERKSTDKAVQQTLGARTLPHQAVITVRAPILSG
ncbi:hypothetical protein GCM10009799_08240 [Nocardiopsis rhodophaea]|uniref:Uncharacterized protein n=1 Tax=Nocardiopsis rhodophaea TaxID=280238 RepID=A0ABN2SE66_9ACTN